MSTLYITSTFAEQGVASRATLNVLVAEGMSLLYTCPARPGTSTRPRLAVVKKVTFTRMEDLLYEHQRRHHGALSMPKLMFCSWMGWNGERSPVLLSLSGRATGLHTYTNGKAVSKLGNPLKMICLLIGKTQEAGRILPPLHIK